jgi:hypothetical protein
MNGEGIRKQKGAEMMVWLDLDEGNGGLGWTWEWNGMRRGY